MWINNELGSLYESGCTLPGAFAPVSIRTFARYIYRQTLNQILRYLPFYAEITLENSEIRWICIKREYLYQMNVSMLMAKNISNHPRIQRKRQLRILLSSFFLFSFFFFNEVTINITTIEQVGKLLIALVSESVATKFLEQLSPWFPWNA